MKLLRTKQIKILSVLVLVACVAASVVMTSCKNEAEKAEIDKKAAADVGFYEAYLADEIAPNIKQLVDAIPSDDPNYSKLVESLCSNMGPVVCQAKKVDKVTIDEVFEKYGKDILPANLKLMWTLEPEVGRDGQECFSLVALKTDDSGKPAMTGESITKAETVYDKFSGYSISIAMDKEGGKKFSWLTARNVGRPLAIVYKDKVLSYPTVNSQIDGGTLEIAGRFTPEETQDFVSVLYGKKK